MTKRDYKIILHVFYKWLRKTEDYPEEVRWIKATNRTTIKLPEELLTVEEVMKLVDTADNIRDKAFILTLNESGLPPLRLALKRLEDIFQGLDSLSKLHMKIFA